MKKFTLFLLFLTFTVYSQNSNQQNIEKIYTEKEVDYKPKLMYGENAMTRFIIRNFKSPKEPIPPQKLICSFIVELDGTISDVKVLNDVHPSYKKEALRILNNFDEPWYPAVKDKKQVRCLIQYPISVGL